MGISGSTDTHTMNFNNNMVQQPFGQLCEGCLHTFWRKACFTFDEGCLALSVFRSRCYRRCCERRMRQEQLTEITGKYQRKK